MIYLKVLSGSISGFPGDNRTGYFPNTSHVLYRFANLFHKSMLVRRQDYMEPTEKTFPF